MQAYVFFSVIGLCSALVGSGILTFSTLSFIHVLQMLVGAWEIFFRSMAAQNATAIAGLNEQMKEAKARTGRFIITGLGLLFFGFACQLIGVILEAKL